METLSDKTFIEMSLWDYESAPMLGDMHYDYYQVNII